MKELFIILTFWTENEYGYEFIDVDGIVNSASLRPDTELTTLIESIHKKSPHLGIKVQEWQLCIFSPYDQHLSKIREWTAYEESK